jgi:hypothetical protein
MLTMIIGMFTTQILVDTILALTQIHARLWERMTIIFTSFKDAQIKKLSRSYITSINVPRDVGDAL